jgi:type IV pilus assembly protein PilV
MTMNGLSVSNTGPMKLQAGFSLLEILVTLVILALGLLGTAGLQAQALRTNQGGQFRTQAVFLAADIAERMEANKAAAVAGGYAVAAGVSTSSSTNCNSASCNSDDLALFDLNAWQNSITNTLPGGSWTITQTTIGNPSVYSIVVSWVDRRTSTTYETAGTGETMSYTTVKAIYN